MMQQAPIVVFSTTFLHSTIDTSERQTGRAAQLSNIEASKAIADLIRTCLGPRAMLKMLLDPMGGIVLTNDGHAILREIDVQHPAAKSMLELARTQDEEVGDGTTSVVVLAGEVLAQAEPFLTLRNMHPLTIIAGFKLALEAAMRAIERVARPINVDSDAEMLGLLATSLGTKFGARWSDLLCPLALRAVRCVRVGDEIDCKRYVRIERIPGGDVADSRLLAGVVLNKDVVHAQMRRSIDSPRVVLLDCPLEYKKGESQTNIEVSKGGEWTRYLQLEEEQVRDMCVQLLAFKPDLVIAEKGISGTEPFANDLLIYPCTRVDLAQHYLVKANVTALRRVKKSDMNRIARACGATIVNRIEDMREADVGTNCARFHIDKIGDEYVLLPIIMLAHFFFRYFAFLDECKNAKACTILLRGASKDILNEVERNLHDLLADARNLLLSPRLCPGGGATEMAAAAYLERAARQIEGVERGPFLAIAAAMEVVPRTLVQNCGASVIALMTELRAKHAGEEPSLWGIDGIRGCLVDQGASSGGSSLPIWEPMAVKVQCFKTAIEAACMILRVDDIVAGKAKKAAPNMSGEDQPGEEGDGHEGHQH